ncbi:hypothetical protein QQF64_031153 [Cirrhinus molitorella]|uniref:Uncharacterized protein n=1 Tax=Cirrhinus molitorella TaxID=172907 RepID=A0ABR3N5N8_9TELE
MSLSLNLNVQIVIYVYFALDLYFQTFLEHSSPTSVCHTLYQDLSSSLDQSLSCEGLPTCMLSHHLQTTVQVTAEQRMAQKVERAPPTYRISPLHNGLKKKKSKKSNEDTMKKVNTSIFGQVSYTYSLLLSCKCWSVVCKVEFCSSLKTMI